MNFLKNLRRAVMLASLPVSLSICSISSADQPAASEETEPEAKELDPASVEKGKQTYAMFCLACHGAEDAGIDSPSNLFDSKWYHGEGREGISKSIRKGILEKGMPGWEQMIPEEDITAVIDYLVSFQKT